MRVLILSIVFVSAAMLGACKSDTEEARSLLNQAQALLREEKPEEAKVLFERVVAEYSHTQEATEANEALNSLKVAERLVSGQGTSVAKAQVDALLAAAQLHNIEHGRFPTQDEGIGALLPYLKRDIPLDPWNNPYIYRFPGEHGAEPDLLSYGADGVAGGEGPDQDIVSWD